MIVSKFTKRTYLVFLFIPFIILLGYYLIDNFFNFQEHEYNAIISAIFCILLFFSLLYFREFRKRAITISISNNEIISSNFYGFGKDKVFKFEEFITSKTIYNYTRYGSHKYENLYLYINDSAVIQISEMYHSNYKELKEIITERIPISETKYFSFWEDLKDAYKL